MPPSPYRVSIQSEPAHRGGLSHAWVREVIRAALTAEDAEHGGRVEVLIAGDETVQRLNSQFLGGDTITDVLSFPANGGAVDGSDDDDFPIGGDPATGEIGQIVLSLPQTERQAASAGLTLKDEAAHLLIHGVLHLLGHDHELADDEAAMRSREDALLIDIIGRPAHGLEMMDHAHVPVMGGDGEPAGGAREAVR